MGFDFPKSDEVERCAVSWGHNTFPGLGSVGRKILDGWEAWEDSRVKHRGLMSTPVLSRQEDEVLAPIIVEITPDASRSNLPTLSVTLEDRMDCRLETSIHNPDRLQSEAIQTSAPSPELSIPATSVLPLPVPSAAPPPRASSPSPTPPPSSTSPPPPPPPVEVSGSRNGLCERKPVQRYGFLCTTMMVVTNPVTSKQSTGGRDK